MATPGPTSAYATDFNESNGRRIYGDAVTPALFRA